MQHDPTQLRDLFLRAKTVLGSEGDQTLRSSRPRNQAYLTAMSRAIEVMGGPDKVTDEQILGAMQIAHEVFPVELEIMAKAIDQ